MTCVSSAPVWRQPPISCARLMNWNKLTEAAAAALSGPRGVFLGIADQSLQLLQIGFGNSSTQRPKATFSSAISSARQRSASCKESWSLACPSWKIATASRKGWHRPNGSPCRCIATATLYLERTGFVVGQGIAQALRAYRCLPDASQAWLTIAHPDPATHATVVSAHSCSDGCSCFVFEG